MKKSEIQERRRKLMQELEELKALERRIDSTVAHENAPSPVIPGDRPPSRSARPRPLRDLLLDALDEIGFMVYSHQVMLYIKARFGREFPSTRMGTLSVDEEKAYRRGSIRQVWLCHGLTHDRAEPVRRLWARSDWELKTRIVTPAFGRAQYLRATARFAALALNADAFADPQLLRFVAADHARDLGIAVKHGQFDLVEWKTLAETQLADAAAKEAQFLEQVLTEFHSSLKPEDELFGKPEQPFLQPVKTGMSQR